MTPQPLAWICSTILLLAVLGGVFALAWHGTLTGTDATAIVTTIIGIAGGGVAAHAGVNAGARAAGQSRAGSSRRANGAGAKAPAPARKP